MDRGVEIIWGVNGRFLFGLTEVLCGSTDMVIWIGSFIFVVIVIKDFITLISFTATVWSPRNTVRRTFFVNRNCYFFTPLITPHGISTISITGTFVRAIIVMICILGRLTTFIRFTSPNRVVVIPSTQIIVPNTLGNYCTNFGNWFDNHIQRRRFGLENKQ